MSNRLFQGVVQQMKGAIDRNIGVIDENGVIVASGDLSRMGEVLDGVREELSFASDFVILGGVTYRYINGVAKSGPVVFVDGGDAEAG